MLRLAGLIDWEAIEDRTRFLRSLQHWNNPAEIISATARSYKIDKWKRQEYRPEVWVEKDALIGVIENVCHSNDVPFFACRGYVSLSEMWRAAKRLEKCDNSNQYPVIIHLGDHDPSGIDMSRDIEDRLKLLEAGYNIEVVRIALNNDQIQEFNPPPNPAKLTDTRAKDYVDRYGYKSWELDALEPSYIEQIIQEKIDDMRNDRIWQEDIEEENEAKEKLLLLAEEWESK